MLKWGQVQYPLSSDNEQEHVRQIWRGSVAGFQPSSKEFEIKNAMEHPPFEDFPSNSENCP